MIRRRPDRRYGYPVRTAAAARPEPAAPHETKGTQMTTATLTAEMLISLDGWAKGEHSPGYFGYFGPDLERWIEEGSARPQHALMGRRTYEALDSVPAQERDEGYEQMTRTPTTVFSRTLTAVDWPGATVESGDLIERVRALKEQSETHLRTIGSLSVVKQLLNAGLVDRLRLLVFPLLVGPGGSEPLFAGVEEADLELVDQRVLDGRILLVEYAPTGRPVPR
jgi:dihydrofolate reductase